MTDKQIIIDGVDVSECTRYCADNGKCTAFKSQYLCSERNNCYTKRILKKNKTINILKGKLLRKEQECEELKKIINEAKNSKLDLKSFLVGEAVQNEYEQQLDQLKAENDELKKQRQADKGLITSTGKMNYQLLQEYDKLKNCLTEIKEIAENAYCLTNGTNKDMANFAKQILQKISECEVE